MTVAVCLSVPGPLPHPDFFFAVMAFTTIALLCWIIWQNTKLLELL